MNLFEFKNTIVTVAGRRILDIPSFSFQRGEVCAIRGPNGSGKSTLLKVMTGLVHPGEGDVFFNGEPVSKLGTAELSKRGVAFLHQYPYMLRGDVEYNVTYGLRVRGLKKKERNRAAAAALERVGLGKLSKRPADQLSGGESKRAALARVLVLKPETLLMDEPFSGVDDASSRLIEELIQEVNALGSTVLFSTHDSAQALRMASRLAGLKDGRLDTFTLKNIFRGHVEETASGDFFVTNKIRISIPKGHTGARIASIPPESVTVALSAPITSARNVFQARVEKIEKNAGSVEIYTIAGEPITARITDESFTALDISQGQDVSLVFKAESVQLE